MLLLFSIESLKLGITPSSFNAFFEIDAKISRQSL